MILKAWIAFDPDTGSGVRGAGLFGSRPVLEGE